MTLGGHKAPIEDLGARIDEIRAEHAVRLNRIINYLADPRTISAVTVDLFGVVDGYNALLALEEAGAHVEYLYLRGLLEIDNLEQVRKDDKTVPIHYRRLKQTVIFDLNNL